MMVHWKIISVCDLNVGLIKGLFSLALASSVGILAMSPLHCFITVF